MKYLRGDVLFMLSALGFSAADQSASIPARIPLKRSSQIQDGFGINTDLRRAPYLAWDRWWWTRMFDAGIKWARIGQYENSTDYTSWEPLQRHVGLLDRQIV